MCVQLVVNFEPCSSLSCPLKTRELNNIIEVLVVGSIFARSLCWFLDIKFIMVIGLSGVQFAL